MCAFFWLSLAPPGWAALAQSDSYVLTKNAWGLSGHPHLEGGGWSIALGAGEALSAGAPINAAYAIHSGYYGGFLGSAGSLRLLQAKIGTRAFFQDGLQVGVPLDAPIELEFSDRLLPESLSKGLVISIRRDHLGRRHNTPAALTHVYDPASRIVKIVPASSWKGNTLYEVLLTPSLQDADGFLLAGPAHVRFLTALNPDEQNVVVHPVAVGIAEAPAPAAGGIDELQIDIPSQALSDFSFALVNRDPVNTPWSVDPLVIQEANRKAHASSGGYAAPLLIQEIKGFDLQGEPLMSLRRPATLSVALDKLAARPRGIALWALDETHRLWVKVPESRLSAGKITAPVARFSVFALMSGQQPSPADVFVFPTPWRPNGPNAGEGPGQTGTDRGGLTFSNLPSECAIQIYTLSGGRVRELHHSDLSGSTGQETWDGRTSGGARAASGVYLWRVESAGDGKNGKLMIIR
jgi:hypothetical protein